ncbi:BgTH12-05155 [Blumeria graminis f. sp. triticale]|uniref:Bgt-55107 n=2 Tax=Blumeria graminis TaxID=34373 RepID=A0A9X9MHU4_BLUGR|nr:BgTH12-05155 [Blumeria graminis f. sp. triticale]VDB87971.1 Bgt-55107 [Blumeria graminis f. sp. tritici]
MRFSSLAIIFQSASIFVTTLAGTSVNHIDENRKSFFCNGVLIEYNQLAQQRTLLQRIAGMTNPNGLFQIFLEK